MKKGKKVFWALFLLVLIISIAVYYYINNNVGYQLRKLEKGSLTAKVNATYFVGEHKIMEAIPLLMNNMDDNRYQTYNSKVPESMSCHVTHTMQVITNAGFSNTCNADGSKTDEEIEKIKNDWKEWYKNSYNK